MGKKNRPLSSSGRCVVSECCYFSMGLALDDTGRSAWACPFASTWAWVRKCAGARRLGRQEREKRETMHMPRRHRPHTRHALHSRCLVSAACFASRSPSSRTTKNPLAAGSRFLAPCFSWRQYAANDHGASIVERMVMVFFDVVNRVSLWQCSLASQQTTLTPP